MEKGKGTPVSPNLREGVWAREPARSGEYLGARAASVLSFYTRGIVGFGGVNISATLRPISEGKHFRKSKIWSSEYRMLQRFRKTATFPQR